MCCQGNRWIKTRKALTHKGPENGAFCFIGGEAVALKEVVAELTLENRLLKKSMIGDGGDGI
jgi:hypothetical protein